MKKFLLLICALLGTVGTWAGTVYTVTDPVQVTDLENLSSSKYYILKNCGSGFYNYYDATNSQLDAKSAYDYSSVVKLNYDGANVTIQQVSTGTFYQGLTNETRVSLGDSPVNFTFNTDNVDSGQFRFANNSLYMNRYGGGTQYPTGASTSFAGNYSRWNIFEVTITESEVWKSSDKINSNTADNTSGKLSSIGFFRLTTPDVDGLSFSSFSLKHLGDNFQSDRYLAISSTKLAVTDNLPASVFAGISNNKASTTGVFTYIFSSPVRLLGNTEYYFYFVQRNNNGTYKLVTHGLAVQTGLSNTGLVLNTSITGDDSFYNQWWPYFNCNYSIAGNSVINSELIDFTTAYKNRDASAQIGYPTSSAISALNTAITTAGTYSSANYKALMSAYIDAIFNINYTPRTDVYYTLTNANVPSGNRGSMAYDPTHNGSTDANGHEFLWYTTSLNQNDPNHLWGFIESEGKYYMYNVGKRQFANVTQSGNYQGSNGDKHTWMFSNDPSVVVLDAGEGGWVAAPNVRVRATSEVTGKQYAMSISTSFTGPVIAFDAVNDGGIPMFFTVSSYPVDQEVTASIMALIEDVTPYRNALKDVIDACELISFGSGLNQYAYSSTYTDALAAANTAYNNTSATKNELQTATANLESAIEGLSINTPATGKFYRIKGYSNNYITSNSAGNNASMNGTPSANNIVYYSADCNLIFFGSGFGLYSTSIVAPAGSTLNTYNFIKGAQMGKYYVKSNATGMGTYCYDHTADGSKLNRNTDPVTSGSYQTDWTLEEVTTLPVNISDAGYATLYAPVALTIPSGVGVKAYYISSLTTTEATLTEITTTIAANTPVILKATAGTYDFVITTGGTDVSATNKLAGQVAAFAVSADDVTNKVYYTLQQNVAGDAVGLFPKTAAGSIAGFKAYLPAANFPPTQSVKGFTFIFDNGDETGINDIQNGQVIMNGEAIFNLAGQRLNKLQRGVNIVNGKKVLVK